jgi:putative hydrolase of the HAD superfamily
MKSNLARALVPDFGGVISCTMFETHTLTERALDLLPGTLRWRGPFDADGDPLWQSMQRGEISERDYRHTRTADVGKPVGRKWSNMQDFVKAPRGR